MHYYKLVNKSTLIILLIKKLHSKSKSLTFVSLFLLYPSQSWETKLETVTGGSPIHTAN